MTRAGSLRVARREGSDGGEGVSFLIVTIGLLPSFYFKFEKKAILIYGVIKISKR